MALCLWANRLTVASSLPPSSKQSPDRPPPKPAPFSKQALAYDLTVPTTFSFLARFKKATGADAPAVSHFSEYLIELALVDFGMLKHPLSLVAAAALHAGLVFGGAEDAYPRALRRHARYELAEVAPVAKQLLGLAEKAAGGSLKAVHKKYSGAKFGEVAKMDLPALALESVASV
jgi:hypothetical protein